MANDEADTRAEVGDASFASVEGVLIFKHGDEGREEEVEVAVDYGHVNSEEEDDRRKNTEMMLRNLV